MKKMHNCTFLYSLQNINAMEHSFAEPEVKQMILEKLKSAYGSA